MLEYTMESLPQAEEEWMTTLDEITRNEFSRLEDSHQELVDFVHSHDIESLEDDALRNAIAEVYSCRVVPEILDRIMPSNGLNIAYRFGVDSLLAMGPLAARDDARAVGVVSADLMKELLDEGEIGKLAHLMAAIQGALERTNSPFAELKINEFHSPLEFRAKLALAGVNRMSMAALVYAEAIKEAKDLMQEPPSPPQE